MSKTDPLALLKELHAKSTQGEWSTPHLSDDSTTCNCRYVLSEGYGGSICDVNVNNGLRISEGGNDAPPLEEAKANGAWIAAAHNAFPELARRIETLEAENARLIADRDLDTDRLEWLAGEVTELWFDGRHFDVESGAEALRQEIDNAARKHLSQLRTKLEALDSARQAAPEVQG